MNIKKRYILSAALIVLLIIAIVTPRSPSYEGTWFKVATESKGPWSISLFSDWFNVQDVSPIGPFGDKSGGIAHNIKSTSTKNGIITIEGVTKREIAGFYLPRVLHFKFEDGVLELLDHDLMELGRYKRYEK